MEAVFSYFTTIYESYNIWQTVHPVGAKKERFIFTLHEKAMWPAALFSNTCDSLFENNS